ncbi:MAG: hypothetical protein V1826_00060 [bacterium]
MKIAIDIDEVLSEFTAEFIKWYNITHGTQWTFDDMVDYYWPNWMGITVEEAIDDVHEFFSTDRFRNLPLVRGAQEGIAELAKQHELYAVTGRQNVVKDITYEWLDRNFPNVFKKIEFTNNYPQDGSPTLAKGEVCAKLGCDVLIDDDTRHVESLMQHGVQMIVFDKQWNAYHRLPSSVRRVSDWPQLLSVINQIATI